MERIIITGGSSYVGRHLVPMGLAAGHQVLYTTFSSDLNGIHGDAEGVQLDLTDPSQFKGLCNRFKPTAIIHLAGSNRSEQMEKVIVEGAETVVAAAARHKARLIHFSTDVIFDGKNPPYTELDRPTPLHAYGRAKVRAEAVVRSSHGDHVIIRPSLIYGLKEMDRGTEWVYAALNKGKRVTLFTNQLRNPVWMESLCQMALQLVGHPYCGIVHAGGKQVLSRAEFGKRLLDWWKIPVGENLIFAPAEADAPWPANTTLDCRLATDQLEIPLPGVDEVIEMVENHSR